MLQVDPAARSSISELLDSDFFEPVRALTRYPEPESESLTTLWEIRADLIARQNVHKLSTPDEF